MNKQKLINVFDKQAGKYSNKREGPEQQRWRRELLCRANGKVLELAAGAGANFPYYPPGVVVTATDFSEAMLTKAKLAAARSQVDVHFLQADIEELDFPEQSFDTIVSTLSMCSYEKPQDVLRKVNRWCKPGGTILLMEHGISTKPIIAGMQRLLNPILYRLYGCHHTRHILELIHNSGIQIENTERHWLSMMYIVYAKPSHKTYRTY